jgi:GNAT superfamily N-acetyltransferase
MLELRPHVGSAADLVRLIDEVQRPQGYRLLGSFDDAADPAHTAAADATAADATEAAAVAGFVVGDKLAWGRHIYIDDLVTRPEHRGRGHAKALLDWVAAEARRLGCAQVHLDSATFRHDAHRRYLTAGYRITSFHFVADGFVGDGFVGQGEARPAQDGAG